MSYIDHAKREFLAVGYKPVDQCEDDSNKWIQENVLELLEVLGKQGHSGTSILFVVDYFSRLAKFEPLCPLSGDDAEWFDTTDTGEMWQNNRCSHVFRDKNGIAYDIDGYVFWHWSECDLDEDEVGYPGKRRYKSCFTSHESCRLITFPYTPEREYVEVNCFEVNKETGEREPGSGWWETIYPEHVIKERAELDTLINS